MDKLASKVAGRWNSSRSAEDAEETLDEMMAEVPSGLERALGKAKVSRDGDQATAKVSWDGDEVTVEIKAIVTVMGDEDGLSTTTSAGYEINGGGYDFSWDGNPDDFSRKFNADVRKVYDKLKDKFPELAKLFV